MAAKFWFPLESNPAVMNTFIEKMGVDISKFSFQDVFSTEDWALEMVARPVVGVVMLFPIKESTEEFAKKQQEKIDAEGQIVHKDVYFMKQTVGNACGTIGILHCIANARPAISIKPDSYLERFFNNTEELEPDGIAEYLENDTEIEESHELAAAEGQSEQVDGDIDTHFICFSHVNGHLYEFGKRLLVFWSSSN